MRGKAAILIVGFAAWCGYCPAAPMPGVVAKSWELEFAFYDPQRISVVLPGDHDPTTFWYMLYTITNTTGKEIGFYPTFHLVTDRLDVVEGDYAVSPSVYDAIKARHKKVYPFFVDPMDMYGTIRQGEDNARTSAVAFGQLDPEVNGFTIFVAGLSGEIVKVRNLTFQQADPETGTNVRFFTLRKTMAIGYDIPGDRRTQPEARPVRSKMEWVMR